MKLVIIEGIGKKATIEKYLGGDYKVFATGGHIRDLPAAVLAVDVKKNFEPKYEIMPGKKETVSKMLAAAKNAERIYLATDPDREGEAISWHLASLLNVDESESARIVFNEISKKAVQKALENPRPIDINLVDAQQARRILDRLVGYRISPVLSKKIQSKLSAGRVQSVTLRLVVEREREILKFKPEEYWPFFSILENSTNTRLRAALTHYNSKKIKLASKEEVDKVVSELAGKQYVVDKIKKSVVKSKPPAPFITSTLQQDAMNKLGLSLKQTTSIAQELYEGVEISGEGKTALVTYIRTDSTRVSDDAKNEARSFISKRYGNQYLQNASVKTTAKKNVQDAHEAIRPISLEKTPESLVNSLSRNHYKLYKLIFERFLASQMCEAEYNSMTVDISAGDYTFRVTGKTPLFDGYTVVYKNFEEEKEDEGDENGKLPNLTEGEALQFIEHKYEQKFTKPPSRYTDASLIKMMEEKGIGRPATYTPTVTLLASREYTEKEGKYIKPTQLGCDITDMLIKYFPELFDIAFTADMESRLDEIEEGGKEWQRVIEGYYNDMEAKIRIALGDEYSLKKPAEKSGIMCEKCGKEMLIREGKYGTFLACSGYPKCKNSRQIDVDENGEIKEVQREESNEVCEKCGKQMVEKMGRFGKFLACSGYPDCKNIRKNFGEKSTVVEGNNGEQAKKELPTLTDEVCEKCGKQMVERMGRYGKFLACSGYPKCKNIRNNLPIMEGVSCPLCGKAIKMVAGKRPFYGCTGYPDCTFASKYPLAEGKCPTCGSYLITTTKKDKTVTVCANKECGQVIE